MKMIFANIKTRIIIVLGSLMAAHGICHAQMAPGQVDIFAGVDFSYRDIYINGRVFDLLINLTPGVKWNLGHRWEVAGQVYIPVVNQYGSDYKRVRVNMLNLSKQFVVGNRWKNKVTGGLFGLERYGFDWKSMFVVNRWLAFRADLGLTGYFSMARGRWDASSMGRFSAIAGPDIWLDKWSTQLSALAGRFVFGDYGVVGEAIRHFKHVSVGFYASYSSNGGEAGGFKVIAMLPPYKRTRRRVNFRPASNFRLTYNVEPNRFDVRQYFTDPEQNERTGWFDRDLLPWGQDTMAPDYVYKEKDAPRKDVEADAQPSAGKEEVMP